VPAPFVPQTVVITDYFEDGSGHPLDGRVIFKPSVTSKTPDGTITRHPIVAKVTGGNLSVELIAPDSIGVTPQGWTYDVRTILGPPGSAGAEGIDAFSNETWSIRPTAATPTVVLRDLTEVDPVPSSAFAVRSVSGVLPDVGGNIALTAEDLALAGVGFVTDAEFTAFTATKAQPSGLASLDSGGLIPAAQIPPIALSDYLGTVASQAAMLALTGQRGDWAIRSDLHTTWVLKAEPSSLLASWQQLDTPVDAVLNVAGKTGAVTLVKADVGLGSVDNTADTAKPVSTLQAAAIALKLDASQKAAASGVASLDGSTKVPIAQLPTGATSSTVTIGNDSRLSDARTPLAHVHTIADVTSLQTILDDNTFGTTDLATLGDYVSSIPRAAASSQDTLSNGFITIIGALSLRSSFVATKLRLHVRGAVGSPGIVTLAVFKGTNRLALSKVVSDSVVTTSFGTIGLKEFSFAGVTVNRGDWVYLALLHTNAGTDPIISTLPGPPSADLINPTAAQTLYGFKGSQTVLPATLDVSASYTANGRVGWFALAV
jgi:hypothetical protein